MNFLAGVLRIMNMFKDYAIVKNMKKKERQICDFPPLSSTYGFFDGDAKDGRCGAGGVLRINREHYFKLKLNYGSRSNTKAEMMTLWCLNKSIMFWMRKGALPRPKEDGTSVLLRFILWYSFKNGKK